MATGRWDEEGGADEGHDEEGGEGYERLIVALRGDTVFARMIVQVAAWHNQVVVVHEPEGWVDCRPVDGPSESPGDIVVLQEVAA